MPMRMETTELAERLRQIRRERFGENGGPELARRLGIPARTWINYEQGVTIPGRTLLALIIETGVEPEWLSHGTGPRYRSRPPVLNRD